MTLSNIDEKAILDAAAGIFAEKGFAGARVDEIAAAAGVNKAMLYYRIGDKEELYRRVVLRGQQVFRKALVDSMEKSSAAPETMRAMIEGIAENALENSLLPSIILRELAGKGLTLPSDGLEGISGFMGIVKSVVTMGVEEGSFRNINPVTFQFIVLGSVFTLALTRELRKMINPDSPGPMTSEEISGSLLDILASGILMEGAKQ